MALVLFSTDSLHVIAERAEALLRPAFGAVEGISAVEIAGSAPLQWVVQLNYARCRALGIQAGQVYTALEQFSAAHPAGILQYQSAEGMDRYPVTFVTSNGAGSAGAIAGLPVGRVGSRTISLADVAHISRQYRAPEAIHRYNGQSSIFVTLTLAPGANSLRVADEAYRAIAGVQAKLPEGYRLVTVYDSTTYLRSELRKIYLRTGAAFGLVLLVVLAVYRRWRYALLVLLTLVANLGIAMILYYMLGLEINLYTLAGIAVSFGLMTDAVLIMSDHIRHRGNLHAWLALLAGTLALAASMVAVFFMDEKVRENLSSFVIVVLVNQAVSVVTALVLCPALMFRLGLAKEQGSGQSPPGRRLAALSRGYVKVLCFAVRRRVWSIMLVVLAFGLPLFLLPARIDSPGFLAGLYNRSIGSEVLQKEILPIARKVLGGSMGLFAERVSEGMYWGAPGETQLYVSAAMPNGTTLSQANHLVGRMEKFLAGYEGIRLFETNIASARQAYITIWFTREELKGGAPFRLKNELIGKAVELGGAGWGVYGLGDGFNNEVREGIGFYTITMYGYDYSRLLVWADTLAARLQANPRVKEVFVLPEQAWSKPDNKVWTLAVSQSGAAFYKASYADVFTALQQQTSMPRNTGIVNGANGTEAIVVMPDSSSQTNRYALSVQPFIADSAKFPLYSVSSVANRLLPDAICRENQQYRVVLQFDYIGSSKFANKHIQSVLTGFVPVLPVGFTAQYDQWNWHWWGKEKKPYGVLLIIVLIIFFIASIIFESLRQPLALLGIIPISYIGLFLTFYVFDLKFDQGGFAAFVLLTGLTVNTGIYVLTEFNRLRKMYPRRPAQALFTKAVHHKIVPVVLTVFSAILGLVPFMLGGPQPFWYSLAAGVTGGLVFCLPGIFLYLPVFLLPVKSKKH